MRGIPKVKKMDVFPERKPVSSLNEWSKEIQAEFNYFNKMLRKHREKGDGVSTFDLTEAMSKRRRRALLNTMEEIYKRYDKAGTALPALGETWIELNLPFETYSHLDRHSHLLFGASIWILDQISSHEGWREVYRLLPTEEDLLDELCYHDVWDSQYAYDLIYSVEYVLHNRNPIESDGAKYERVLTSDYLARISNAGTAIEGDQNRKNFEALIAMIPQEAIDLAVTHFKDSFWDWVERYFKHAEPLLKAVEECEDKIRDSQLTFNRLADLLNASIERVEKARRSTGKSKPIGASNLSVLNKTKNVLELAAQKKQAPLPFGEFSAAGILSPNGQDPERDKLLDESIELSMKADKMHERIDETIDQANALHTEARKYSMYMARQGRITRDNADDIKGAAISPMEPLSIADPYEMCFALLYLIEKDDDLPWLYGAGCGLMGEVIETLPWGIIEYDEMDDEAWEELPPPLPKSITIPNPYERNYRMKDDFDFPRNLAQIIYEETGCILPRNLHVYDGKAKLLGKYGIRGKDAAAALMLMSTLGMNRRSAEALNFDADLDFGHDEMEAGPREKTEEKENQTVSLEELRAENKRLKAALHAADKENRDTKKKMASLKTTADREHRELSDLREYVFNQEAEEGALEEEIDETKWPYEVQRDIGMLPCKDVVLADIYVGSNFDPSRYFHHFEARDEIYETEILAAEDDWWKSHIETGLKPAASKNSKLDRAVAVRYTPSPLSDPTIAPVELAYSQYEDLYNRLLSAEEDVQTMKAKLDTVTNFRDTLRDEFIAAMGGSQEALLVDRNRVPLFVLRNGVVRRDGINMESLKQYFPEAYEKCKKTIVYTTFSTKVAKTKKRK